MNRKQKLGASYELRGASFFKLRGNKHHTTRAARRGILLLVVLSLLTLFLMIGTAFLVTANQYRRANKVLARVTEASNAPVRQGRFLDEVLNQLVRDTNNQNSVLRYHSLLRDMYGNDGVEIGPNTTQLVRFVDRLTFTYVDDLGNTVDSSILDSRMSGIGDQFFWVAVQFDLPQIPTPPLLPLLPPLREVDSYYNGHLLTFADGKLRNTTSRIVGYDYQMTLAPTTAAVGRAIAVFTLLPLNANEQIVSLTLTLDSVIGGLNRALINGRPFNGTGVGYDLGAGVGAKLTSLETLPPTGGIPSALLSLVPNSRFFEPTQVTPTGTLAYSLSSSEIVNFLPQEQQKLVVKRGLAGLGGSDESYDAPDYQNMALAMLPVNPVETNLTGQPRRWPDTNPVSDWPATLPSSLSNAILPSFHRPALINYWANQMTLGTEPNMLRKVLLRPSWYDHPNFTGSNPDLSGIVSNFRSELTASTPDPAEVERYSNQLVARMIYGPWDVDNDNDGVRDSVWVDFGGPIMKSADGKLVKPMAALLVLDMDGRLNLNAHGSLDIVNANPAPPFSQPVAGAGNTTNLLAQGQGYGPAEISLTPLMPGVNPTERRDWYNRFFDGIAVGDNVILNDSPGPLTPPRFFARDRVGKMGASNVSGRAGFDLAAQIKMQGMPQWADGSILNTTGTANPILGGYATPPDLRGRYALGINDFGQPVYEALDLNDLNGDSVLYDNLVTLNQDSPYEVDLSLGASRGESATASDGPYSVAELERILRAYDVDAGTLPSRIWELAGEFKQSSSDTTPDLNVLNRWRTLLTTDSYDLPVPNVVVPQWMVLGPNGALDPPGPTSDDFADVMSREPVNATFADLLEYRLRVGFGFLDPVAYAGSAANQAQVRQEMRKLLPPDLADGLRLDINRAFGNGRDDDNNGVVDEPGENEGAFWVASNDPANALVNFKSNTTGLHRDDPILLEDRNNDGVANAADLTLIGITGIIDTFDERVVVHNLRRQMLARHLYVLAMTLVDPLPTTGTAAQERARARRLAQWAINIVDFRDPDNIMTAFEYDVNPFDGWGSTIAPVDGIPNAATYTTTSQAQLVWGSERPELVITETLAWHDIATEDLPNESPNPGDPSTGLFNATPQKDADVDQLVRPRGAAFIELYNPWPSNPAVNADTHDTATVPGTDLGVDLSAIAVDPADPTRNSPVWRLMMYRVDGVDRDPDSPDTANRPTTPDRSVYFTMDTQVLGTNLSNLDLNDGVAFFATRKVPSVRPGRYMVVGSGRETAPNSLIYETQLARERAVNPVANRRVKLDTNSTSATNSVQFFDENGLVFEEPNATDSNGPIPMESPLDPNPIDNSRPSLADVAIINEPRRFTLSEPARFGVPYGYPNNYPPGNPSLRWYEPNDPGVPATVSDQYKDGFYGTSPSTPKAIDTPLDRIGGPWQRSDSLAFQTSGTKVDFRTIYLQRLANPLLPFNQDTNPYLTVDVSTSNLTVFNSRSNMPGGASNSNADNQNASGRFYSVERGWKNDPSSQTTSTATQNNLWARENPLDPTNLAIRKAVPAAATEKRPVLRSSSRFTMKRIPDCTLGFLNRSFMGAGLPAADPLRQVQPEKPFPWMNWNNRPYISGTELMQVPTVRSSQLLRAFSTSLGEKYEGSLNPTNPMSTTPLETDGAFGHLPNFFRHKASATGDGIAGLYRVLEYLQVPSRFVGTETWLNPAAFGQPVNATTDPRMNRQPPFNRISSYREPGRVNLNTIVSADVWDGGLLHRQLANSALPWDPFMNNYLQNPAPPNPGHTGPLFVDASSATQQGILESRRGYAGANVTLDSSLLLLDPNVPTFFANPFRSSDAGNLVPLLQLRRASVDCQELRSDKLPQITQAGGVLNPASTGADPIPPSGIPLMAGNKTTPYDNANRNPYFRYQPMTRLSNLTTTRSNVYAVWMTIGFFEVEEAVDRTKFKSRIDPTNALTQLQSDIIYDKVYPDGYQLGKEAGLETGNIQRIREFAVIDRTIPVAFEPGKNHNIDQAIRLRRRID